MIKMTEIMEGLLEISKSHQHKLEKLIILKLYKGHNIVGRQSCT